MSISSSFVMATYPASFSPFRCSPSPLFIPTTLTLSSRRRRSVSNLIIAFSSPVPGQFYPTDSPLTGLAQTFFTTHFASIAPVGPLFFASMSDGGRAPRSMGTPIAVIVARLAKWLDTFLCVLQLRVLLSLFPNIQGGKPPMSAIRALFEPHPSLFRFINSSDVSPALASLLLGLLRLVITPPGSY